MTRILPALIASGLVLAACEDKEQQARPEIVRPVVTLKVNDSEGYLRRAFSGRAKAANEVE
ncbi:MAG: hypothetical protein ACR2PM_02535, partial [Hyphomicrobiales bacterium]